MNLNILNTATQTNGSTSNVRDNADNNNLHIGGYNVIQNRVRYNASTNINNSAATTSKMFFAPLDQVKEFGN
jgi:hypothetical protein